MSAVRRGNEKNEAGEKKHNKMCSFGLLGPPSTIDESHCAQCTSKILQPLDLTRDSIHIAMWKLLLDNVKLVQFSAVPVANETALVSLCHKPTISCQWRGPLDATNNFFLGQRGQIRHARGVQSGQRGPIRQEGCPPSCSDK